MSKKKGNPPKVASQAVIVITHYANGSMVIRSDNDTTSEAAKMADAICNLSMAVIEGGRAAEKVEGQE